MFFSWSNISHNLSEIHQQAKEASVRNNFLISHIKMKQFDVTQKIDQIQKDLSFSSLSQCFLNMKDAKILTDLYWNFFKFEIINDPAEFGFPKSKLLVFIQQITKNLLQMASILNFNCLQSGDCPSIPFQIEPIDYVLFSTIPSLFGHFWSAELIEKYIDFIFIAATTNNTFSELYLEMSLSNLIRVTCNQKFFSKGIGDPLMNYLQSSSMTEQECVQIIFSKVHEKIFLIPRHIRRIITRFNNEKERLIYTPSVFVARCILLPAMQYPKEWGAINSKFPIDDEGKTKIKKVIKLIYEISKGTFETNELTYAFNDFINDIADVDDQNDAITLSDVLPLLGKESISLLFSLPDISILAYLVYHSQCPMLIKGTAEKLINKKVSPHLFVSCDIKEIKQYQIVPSGSLFKANNDPYQSSLVSAIFTFFEIANVINDAPSNSIKEFIEFHQMYAKNINDTKSIVSLMLINSLCPKEWPDIMPALDDEIKRRRKLILRNESVFLDLNVLNQKCDEIAEKIAHLFKIAIGSHASNIFESFIKQNPDLQDQLSYQTPGLLISPEKFTEFFNKLRMQIKEYTTNAPQAYETLLSYGHCWVMKTLTFQKFKLAHPDFNKMDNIIENANEQIIKSYCIMPAPAKIRHLFNSKIVFGEAISLLSIGRHIENPLIALPYLASSIETLNRMYLLEFEKNAQADELTPLIHYLFLTSKIPSLFSFIKYLDFYISPLLDQQLYLNEAHVIGFTHLINHMDSLFSFLSTNIHTQELK